MAQQWDASITIGCSTVIDQKEILNTFSDLQATADKNAVVLRITGDEKDFKKVVERLQATNPEITTKVLLAFDEGRLRDATEFLNKVVSKQINSSGAIGTAFKNQIKAGLGDKDAKETLTSVIKETFGDASKNTSGNVKIWIDSIKKEFDSFDFDVLKSMKADDAMKSLMEMSKKIEQVRKIFGTSKADRNQLGITNALDPEKVDFKLKDYETKFNDFYSQLGRFIDQNSQKLFSEESESYKELRANALQYLTTYAKSNGKPLFDFWDLDGLGERTEQVKAEITSASEEIAKTISNARTFIDNNISNYKEDSPKAAQDFFRNLEIIRQFTGKEYEATGDQESYLNAWKENAQNKQRIVNEVSEMYSGMNQKLENLKKEEAYLSNFQESVNKEIDSRVEAQSGASSGKSIDVEINPVITDPAEFIAKIEAQLAEQVIKIAVEPTINSVADFQELLRQQLPNEFIDVKFNLENGSKLDLSGIIEQFDNLTAKIEAVKENLSKLETLSADSLSSIKSIFEQFSIQPSANSTQFNEILATIEKLEGDVSVGIDADKLTNLISGLEKIGKLAVSPTIDLSKFNLKNLNPYLGKSAELIDLGNALDSLANGLDSLNIALNGANFTALKDFNISDSLINNLPKFGDGLEKLAEKLNAFSSSSTGVLSSISQITSQAKSLEYLYNLANSPNSSKQSNIVGNGLMNAFDKSAINTIQHPAGGTDEVAALAKEYQWLTSQAKAYFTLASKYAKGTISSEDSLKLTQLERALTGAIQRMSQFQETDQSLVTAQNDLQNALSQCGTAVENSLVNNLTKALDKIDTAENKALGFSNSIQDVRDKVTEIQKVFTSGGLVPTSDIEKAEVTLQKALADVKQLKKDIAEAQKTQENEIKNSYKNIFENYKKTALSKAGGTTVTDEVEIRKLVNEYNYLNDALSEYIRLLEKESANPDKSSDRKAKLDALTKAYTEFLSRASAGVDTESRLSKASADLSNSLEEAGKSLSTNLSKRIGEYINNLKNAKDDTTKYSDTLKKLQEVQQKLTSLSGNKVVNVEQLTGIFKEYQVGANAYSEAMSKIKAAQKEVLESSKAQLILNIEQWLNKNTKAAKQYGEALKQIQAEIGKVSTAEELDDLKTKTLNFQKAAESAKLTGSAFADTLKKKFKELGTYLMSFASFYQVVYVIKQGISIAHDYDDAFTEMRKVTDASTTSLKEFQKESFKLADQVGTTAKDLQQSTADWLRLGESFEEAKKSAQDTTVLLNVSKFEDIDSATDSLVAMSQAFKDLDKMEIIDKLNNVGNNFSISTDELAESLQRSVATLKVAGNDLDEAIALTVAGRLTA